MGEAVEFDGISGYLAVGEGPGIVVLHEWWGLVPHIKDVCERFARLGFTALAPDLYHGATASNAEPDDAEKLLMELDRRTRDRRSGHDGQRGATARLREGWNDRLLHGGRALARRFRGSARSTQQSPTTASGRDSGERTITNPILVHVAEHEEHNWPALPEHFPKWFDGMNNAEVHIYSRDSARVLQRHSAERL